MGIDCKIRCKTIALQGDAFGLWLKAGLLQTRNAMRWCRDEAPDNNTLRPIAFASQICQQQKEDTVT